MRPLSFRSLVILFFALSLGLIPFSATQARSHEETHHWNWLSEADKTRLLASIPPAPAPGSDIDKADETEVLKDQQTRTPQDIAEARADEHFSLEMVSRVLGPSLTPANYPVTLALVNHALEDESLLNSTLKKRYKRLRPYQEHAEVKPLFQVEQYSYPSGHSSGSHIIAYVLAELFPAKKEALINQADAVGRSRVVAGVHYPSDVAQGKILAEALRNALKSNPGFQKDLALAQIEVAQRKNSSQ